MARNRKSLFFDMDIPEQREAYQKLTECCDGHLNMTKISLSILSLYKSPSESEAATRSDLEALENRLMEKLNNLAVVAADPRQPEAEKTPEEAREAEEEPDPNELPDELFTFL